MRRGEREIFYDLPIACRRFLANVPLEQLDDEKIKNEPVFDAPINFHSYGLTLTEKKQFSNIYTKRISEDSYIEVTDAKGVISIDILNGNIRTVVASRYECSNQEDLNFLLTKGRVKAVFTAV